MTGQDIKSKDEDIMEIKQEQDLEEQERFIKKGKNRFPRTCYDNRELSWLKFNGRVLEEAADRQVPLCERITFSDIFTSNLDEFFMVRVGSIYDQMLVSSRKKENKTGMTAGEQLNRIFKATKLLLKKRMKFILN